VGGWGDRVEFSISSVGAGVDKLSGPRLMVAVLRVNILVERISYSSSRFLMLNEV
jgi:hypothetical protein